MGAVSYFTSLDSLAYSELFPLDCFRCNFMFALKLEYPLEYNHDTSQLCITGHDDVSRWLVVLGLTAL